MRVQAIAIFIGKACKLRGIFQRHEIRMIVQGCCEQAVSFAGHELFCPDVENQRAHAFGNDQDIILRDRRG